jgi:uncharacterized protein YgiB involved in biofilm formation
MKYAVIAFILGLAGFMLWLWLNGECPGGRVVTSEAQCVSDAGLPQAFCIEVFRRAPTVARAAATVYTDEAACRADFGECLPHALSRSGFVPRPRGFCVSADPEGRVQTMEPVYRRLR